MTEKLKAEPFHVSRSSDGVREWFAARDPASGVSIPARDRDDASALAASLNQAVALHAARPTPATDVSAEDGARRIADEMADRRPALTERGA